MTGHLESEFEDALEDIAERERVTVDALYGIIQTKYPGVAKIKETPRVMTLIEVLSMTCESDGYSRIRLDERAGSRTR